MIGDTSSTAMYFGVDAGGTNTRVTTRTSERSAFTVPSINPASVGIASAEATLVTMFQRVRQLAPVGVVANGWVASAAVSETTLSAEVDRIGRAAAIAGGEWQIVVTGDVAPFLWSSPLSGSGIVLVAGTGSCAIGRHDGRMAVAGGYEYLASDEGGGFTIGLDGIRAAARSYDGRGPRTSLLDAVTTHFGLTIPAVGRHLGSLAHPKSEVAAFAPFVLSAADRGDEVARRIVNGAVSDLVDAVVAVSDTLQLSSAAIVLTGGLFQSGCSFADSVEMAVSTAAGPATIVRAFDGADRALECRQSLGSVEAIAPMVGATVSVIGSELSVT